MSITAESLHNANLEIYTWHQDGRREGEMADNQPWVLISALIEAIVPRPSLFIGGID
jgi:hypothetical protein